MRRSTGLLAGLALGFGVLLGCGPEKKLPEKGTSPTDPVQPEVPSLPTVSEPEAKKIVENAIRAATDGHPERLEKARTCKSTVKGTMEWPGPIPGQTVAVAATRVVEASWPDRARATYELSAGAVRRVTLGIRQANGWQLTRTEDNQQRVDELDRDYHQVVSVDMYGQFWMPLLVPLTDPKVVVYDAKKVVVGKDPMGKDYSADVLKLSAPGYPVFTLWFDDKSFLGRVEYSHAEKREEVRKALLLSGHAPQNGLQLPTKMEFRRNDRLVEQWKSESWDFPDKLDSTIFDQPK